MEDFFVVRMLLIPAQMGKKHQKGEDFLMAFPHLQFNLLLLLLIKTPGTPVIQP
jgi:hypothetical protein